MRLVSKIVSALVLTFGLTVAGAQTTINPSTQINWPQATGSGNPTTTCSAAKYGMLYTDTTSNIEYVCMGSGWSQLGSTASNYLPSNGLTSSSGGNLNAPGTVTANNIALSTSVPIAAPIGTVAAKCVFSNTGVQTPECYGAVGDGHSHPLSTVTSVGATNTTGWTLAQWQTIYPFATSLSNEIDRLALQLISTTYCNASGSSVEIFPFGAYMLDWTWDVNNAHTGTISNLTCSVKIKGAAANVANHSAFYWDGPNAMGVQLIGSASGGTGLCSTSGCTVKLAISAGDTGSGSCNNVDYRVTMGTGGSWTGAVFLKESGGDSCVTAPTQARVVGGGSGTVSLSNVTLGWYGGTAMLSFTNSVNSSIENVSLYGGQAQTGHMPNGIDWHESFDRVAVNTHNTMRNVFVGGLVSPPSGLYPWVSVADCYTWTGTNTNNDQMTMSNLQAHDCVDSYIDPIQQAVLMNADTLTADNSSHAMFVLNSNWVIKNENGDFNAITFYFTDGTEFLGYGAQGMAKFVLINAHPEADGQFINASHSNGIDVKVDGGSWGNGSSFGIQNITSATGGTLCATNGCTMTLTATSNGCTGTVFTATLPTGGSWAGATFAVVNRGFQCSYHSGSFTMTADISNGGSGSATLTIPAQTPVLATTGVLQQEFIAGTGGGGTFELDHFNFYGSPGKINLSGGNGKTLIVNTTGGTWTLPCLQGVDDADYNGWVLLSSQVDSGGYQSKIRINNYNQNADRCNAEFGSGNPNQTIANNQNAQRGSNKNYVKNGALSYTLSGDYNSTTDLLYDSQNGNSSFQAPAHRWRWDMAGVENSTDNGTGSTFKLQRNIGTGSSWQDVVTYDRTTGNATFANNVVVNGTLSSGGNVLPKLIASGTTALSVNPIAAYSCQAVTAGSVNSATATGALTSDVVSITPNASLTAVTGYAPSASGGLALNSYLTAGFVNFDVCNWTSAAITPGAVTLNWRVAR